MQMFRYASKKEQKVEAFKNAPEAFLDAGNRWVKLAALLPWDALAEVYGKTLSGGMGAPSVDARVVIGAVVIKHKLKLDDRGTIDLIRENPYMQYFLGLDAYTYERVFDPSLFVSIRKRLGPLAFDAMTNALIEKVEETQAAEDKKKA